MLTILFWNFVWKQNTISLSIQYATCELTSEARVPWLCPPLPCTLLLPSLSPPCPLLSTKRNCNFDPLEASHRLCPLLILDWESEERENKEHAERHFYFALLPLSPVSSLYSSTAVIALLCTRLLSSLFSVLSYLIIFLPFASAHNGPCLLPTQQLCDFTVATRAGGNGCISTQLTRGL